MGGNRGRRRGLWEMKPGGGGLCIIIELGIKEGGLE